MKGIYLSKFWNIKASLDNQPTELFVYGEIADSTYWDEVGAKEFVADLSKVTSNDITVRINSDGGSVGWLQIDSNGNIVLGSCPNNTYLNLDGISFPTV